MSRNSRNRRKTAAGLAGLGSAAAIMGAGIAAMATGSAPTAAPQADHSGVQSATLTQATTGGTGTVDTNAGFVTPPTPLPTTPSLSGSPAPKTTPVFPGVTQDTTSSTNNPGGNSFPFLPLTTQSGIAATPSGLALSPSTSNSDPLGFGNVGIAPAGRVTFNADGTTTVNPGGVFAISTPLGGGSSTFGFPVTIDDKGNAKFTAWDNFVNGLVNLPDLKNTTNTTGFASDQPTNPNFNTNIFGGTPTGLDPLSQQTLNNLGNFLNTVQANSDAAAVNSLRVPTMQELFPDGIPGDATSGSLLGVPGPSNTAAGSFANIDAMFPNSVNSFAPVNTSSGIPTFQQAYQAALAAGNGAGDAAPGATNPSSTNNTIDTSGVGSSLPQVTPVTPTLSDDGTGGTSGAIANVYNSQTTGAPLPVSPDVAVTGPTVVGIGQSIGNFGPADATPSDT